MHRAGLKMWIRWLVMASLLISGCGPPITTRLVTIELEKGSEADTQRVKTIGVLPFNSPDQAVGRQLAAKIAKELNHDPFVARAIKVPEMFQPKADSLRALGRKAQVGGLLLGEITQYSVQASIDFVQMRAFPEFGSGNSSEYSWVGIRENPSIADTFYYRVKPLQGPATVRVAITRVSYSLTLHLRFIEVQSGDTLWDQEIVRNVERVSLPGSLVDEEAELEQLQDSMVAEVVTRLRPQESTVQRIIRAPHLAMDPTAAKWVRRGLQAAAKEDWVGAERLFLKAMREAPDECSVNGSLGVAYENNGKLLEAVAAYERAYHCQPRDPTYRYYSDDLQTAFAPDLSKKELPTLVLGISEDGMIYLDRGTRQRQHPGSDFTVYRTEVLRDQTTASIKKYKEIEIARGSIIEVRPKMSLGRLLLYDPEREVKRGDLVRFGER